MFPQILERISFAGMRENFARIDPMADSIWKDSGNTFMNKSTNGRWRDVLGDDEIALYEAAVAPALTPDTAQWLEHDGPLPVS